MPHRILAWVKPGPHFVEAHFVSVEAPDRAPATAQFDNVFDARAWIENEAAQFGVAVEWNEPPAKG